MPNIFDLAGITTSIGDALRANREGNAERRKQALAQAFQLLQGAQTAAQTRETIGRETRAQELFPDIKKQGQIATEQAEMGLTKAKNLKTLLESKGLPNVDFDLLKEIHDVVQGYKVGEELGTDLVKTEADRLRKESQLGLEKAKTGLVTEPNRRLAEVESEKARFRGSKLAGESAMYESVYGIPRLLAESKAKTIPKEYDLKLRELKLKEDTLSARLLEANNAAEKARLEAEALKAEEDRRGIIQQVYGVSPEQQMAWEWVVKNEAFITAQDIAPILDRLGRAKASIQAAATIQDIVNATSSLQSEIKDNVDRALEQGGFFNEEKQQEVATPQDKAKAIGYIVEYEQALSAAEKKLPIPLLPAESNIGKPNPQSDRLQSIIDEGRARRRARQGTE